MTELDKFAEWFDEQLDLIILENTDMGTSIEALIAEFRTQAEEATD